MNQSATRFELAGSADLKGIAEPIPLYRVQIGERERPDHDGTHP
jgi:class 3 adenylate cyclase